MNDENTDPVGRTRTSPEAAGPGPASGRRGKSKIRSVEILAGAREVLIEHEGDEYRLRHTSKGKLILTK